MAARVQIVDELSSVEIYYAQSPYCSVVGWLVEDLPDVLGYGLTGGTDAATTAKGEIAE